MSSSPSQPSQRAIVPIATTVSHLPGVVARTYTHVHPFFVLAFFRLRFSTLVDDPVSELLRGLIPLSIFQTLYTVICLPACATSSAGQTVATSRPTKSDSKRRDPRKDARKNQGVGKRITTALISLVLSLIPSTTVLTALLILFGAPLTTHHAHTLLTAAHMSLLAVFPLFYVHGVDRTAWWEIVAFMLPFDEVWGGTVGAVLGAWLGAVPIPLDWDREWQKWPVTIVTGAYIGWIAMRTLGEWALKGKRISFDA